METMIEIRESIINVIKRYQTIFDFLIKFVVGVMIYAAINNIGHGGDNFAFLSSGGMAVMFTVFMGVLFAILPMNANYIFMILFTTIQFSSQLEVALVVFIALLSIFLFYGHFSKKEGMLVIGTLMAFYFNIPYVIPLIAGMYFGVTAIIPIGIGALIWSYSDLVNSLMGGEGSLAVTLDAITDVDLDEVLDAFMALYESFSTGGEQVQNWLFLTISMFMAFIFVYIVSRLSIDYAKEIAIGMGTVLNIFLFMFASAFTTIELNVVAIVFFALFSGGIVYIFSFFDMALDYPKSQRVEFQDDDYYYQVKMIPKRKSKAIRAKQAKVAQEMLVGDAESERQRDRSVPRGTQSASPRGTVNVPPRGTQSVPPRGTQSVPPRGTQGQKRD